MLLTASLNNALKETSAATLGTEHSKPFVCMGVDLLTYPCPLTFLVLW